MSMKKLSIVLLMLATLTLPFACSEKDPSNEVVGPGTDDPNGPDDPNQDDPEVQKFEVGDYYKVGLAEGVVAYVDESGEHGLILSLDETRAQWSTEHELLTKMGGEFSMDNGAWNCEYIYLLEDWANRYPAFAWCYDKNVLGLKAWFLPSIYELQRAHEGLEAINATLNELGATPIATGVNDNYWTSVEVGVQSAYAFSFYEGDIASNDLDKLNEHLVRAMRKF